MTMTRAGEPQRKVGPPALVPIDALGALIESRRRELGLTRQNLADACDVRLGAVNIWIRGVSPRRGDLRHKPIHPRPDTIMSLAHVLQLDPNDLFALMEPTPRKSPKRPPTQKSPYCLCGCGQVTSKARTNQIEDGRVAGEHNLWLPGHKTSDASLIRPLYNERGPDECWPGRRNFKLVKSARRERYYVMMSAQMPAHRHLWIEKNGPIPDGEVLTKRNGVCDDTTCVNPDHWEPVRKGSWRTPWGPAPAKPLPARQSRVLVCRDCKGTFEQPPRGRPPARCPACRQNAR